MRSNLTVSSAMALISISSVSMISGSRIETPAWHMRAPDLPGLTQRRVGQVDLQARQLLSGSVLHRGRRSGIERGRPIEIRLRLWTIAEPQPSFGQRGQDRRRGGIRGENILKGF